MLKGKSLIDPMDFTVEELEEIFELADDIIIDPKKYLKVAEGRVLATLFYEPSTRTRLSFETAMIRLGGNVVGFSEPSATSVSKGETIADTVRVVGSYADIIAMRHPKEGAPKIASMYSEVPVINAGDGGHQHPTQTLTDLLTIRSVKERLSNLTIGLCGDLKFGRTVHSLIKAMSRYENNKFILISPEELKIPDYIKKEVLEKNNIEYVETSNMEEVMGDLDILYMTRVQKERFSKVEDYERLKDSCILNKEKLDKAREDMIILHPLPRVNEISYDIDSDPRAYYFKQVKYGMYARMALMAKLLGVTDNNKVIKLSDCQKIKIPQDVDKISCSNPTCITSDEKYVPHKFYVVNEEEKEYRCAYCDKIYKEQ